MSDVTLTRLTSIPIDGVTCIVVDGNVTRVHLPGGIEITAPYSTLSITGPKPPELKAPAPPAGEPLPF